MTFFVRLALTVLALTQATTYYGDDSTYAGDDGDDYGDDVASRAEMGEF